MEATVSDPRVVGLSVQMEGGSVTALTADVVYGVVLGDMEVEATKTVDAWTDLPEARKNQFQTFMELILNNL